MVKGMKLDIGGKEIEANMYVLDIHDFDVILRMD